ncbi:MAG: phosphonate metabolism protein/1,5-bisphosphokinase (PRPP-forming) PhnN [Candidatus Lokiarchaeota archaeon]
MKQKIFPGTLFLVVGNSGSGKDSIINEAIKKYPKELKKLYAPRRYITRPPSETEDNIFINEKEFKRLDEEGKFVLTWHVYELSYGIPKKVDNLLIMGNPVVLNVSRTVIPKARKKYKNLKVINISVPIEIIRKRIFKRGREDDENLESRFERAKKFKGFSDFDYEIQNIGELNDAVTLFLNYIASVIKKTEE